MKTLNVTPRQLVSLCLIFFATMSLHFQVQGQNIPCCDNNILKNGDLELGARVGNGSFYGCATTPGTSYVNYWCGMGSPQYYFSPIFNSNSIIMWGIGTNFSAGEGFYQATSIYFGNSYRISFNGHFRDQVPTGPDSVIFRFRAYVNAPTGVSDPSGTLIGEYVVKNTSPGNFTLPVWTAPLNYNYLSITVHNGSTINNGAYVSWAGIDNICMSRLSVDIPRKTMETNISIFPNPTDNKVVVRYPADYGDPTQILLTDATGREIMVPVSNEMSGSFELDLQQLASGMYFMTASFLNSEQKFTRQIIRE